MLKRGLVEKVCIICGEFFVGGAERKKCKSCKEHKKVKYQFRDRENEIIKRFRIKEPIDDKDIEREVKLKFKETLKKAKKKKRWKRKKKRTNPIIIF